MNLFNIHRLVSCSTQTHSKKNIKNIRINKNPSFKNIKIDDSQFYNIKINNRYSSNLKGKKIIKKKRILELYNNLYNNNDLSQDKSDNSKKNIINENHKKGEISLSFGGNDSLNKIVLNKIDFIKKHSFRILKKYPNNSKNRNDEECEYPLLNKNKLPLYKVKKILKDNNNILYRYNDNFMEYNNLYNYEKTNEDFPIIAQGTKRTNTFDSIDIKKENDEIINDLFRKACLSKKKIDKKIIKINLFNKYFFPFKNENNYGRQVNNKFFIKRKIIDNHYPKLPTEIKAIKNKVKKLYNHNRTSDNIGLSNEY